MASDPHEVLGVPRGASAADVQAAYRRLARRYHPDAPGGGDPARMRALNDAYTALRDGTGVVPTPHPPTNSRNHAVNRRENASVLEDARRRTVVVTLVVLAVLVTGLAILAATGDEVVEPRAATVTASGMRFLPAQVRVAAGVPVELDLVNRDVGQQHNLAVYRSDVAVTRGRPVTGPTSVAYEVGPLRRGTYTLRCDIVPTMTATLVAA